MTSSGKDDGEGLVADRRRGLEHGVAEPELLLLPDGDDVGEAGDLLDLGEQDLLVALAKGDFELEGAVEVVEDRVLAARGDDDDAPEPGLERLLDAVLDDGLVDEGQHFLRNDLGRREEARAVAGAGENTGSEAFHGRAFYRPAEDWASQRFPGEMRGETNCSRRGRELASGAASTADDFQGDGWHAQTDDVPFRTIW
jgi:hypothetical protein